MRSTARAWPAGSYGLSGSGTSPWTTVARQIRVDRGRVWVGAVLPDPGGVCELARAAEGAPVADELSWLLEGGCPVAAFPCDLDETHDGVGVPLRGQNPDAGFVFHGGEDRVPVAHAVPLRVEQSGHRRMRLSRTSDMDARGGRGSSDHPSAVFRVLPVPRMSHDTPGEAENPRVSGGFLVGDTGIELVQVPSCHSPGMTGREACNPRKHCHPGPSVVESRVDTLRHE